MILNRLWNATTGCIKTFWVRTSLPGGPEAFGCGRRYLCGSQWLRCPVARAPRGWVLTSLEPRDIMWSSCDLASPYQRTSKIFKTIWNDLKRFRPFEVREVCSFYVRRMVRLLPAFWLAMAWTGSGESGRGSWRLHTSNLSAGFQASRQGMPRSSHGSRQSSLIVLRQEPNFTNPVFEMRFAAALVEDRHLVRAKSNAL